MAQISTSVEIPTTGAGRGTAGGFARWLASERVFRLIPFVLVEALFVLIILVPFALTIWISLLKWRANRPFETARFAGLENYETVLGNDQFWLALGRTFYFAGVAVALELIIGFVLAMLVSRCTRSRGLYTTVFLIPMMIIPVVVGYDFSMLLIDTGPFNRAERRSPGSTCASAGCRTTGPPSRGHHRRRVAVDVADVPDLRVRPGGAAAAPHPGRPGHGRHAVAGVPPRPAPAAQAHHRHRRGHPDDGGLQDLRHAHAAHPGRAGERDRDDRLFLWRNAWVFNKITYAAAASLPLLVLFSVPHLHGIWLLRREKSRLDAEPSARGRRASARFGRSSATGS